jgi:hypothetical protein
MREMSHESPTLTKILLIAGVIFIAQIACYYRSFGIKPASDDFPVVNEIVRGQREGPGVFFRQSMTPMHHRPFKSLGIWAAGTIAPHHREFAIRVLHFSAMAGYAVVLALWIVRLRLTRFGAAVALAVVMFHPALPQALGSVDGVDSIASSALIWLGAWFVLIWREHVIRALIAATICFILAAGWKEYSFAIVPLAVLTCLCFCSRGRWRNATILGLGLCIVFVAILAIRQRAMPGGYGAIKGARYVSHDPVQWIKNITTLGVGLLFFGDSISVYLHQTKAVLGLVALSVLIAFATITIGLFKRGASGKWIVFLLGSFVAAALPAIVIFHVSEMYLPPIMIPLALLCGLAAEGWLRAAAVPRLTVAALATAALFSSIWTIHVKIEGLRDVGDRAERQLRQILALLPPDAHDLKIVLLFDQRELSPLRTYAVYRMGDDMLLVHPNCFNWLVPDRHIEMASFWMGDPLYHPADYDVHLLWDSSRHQFAQVPR